MMSKPTLTSAYQQGWDDGAYAVKSIVDKFIADVRYDLRLDADAYLSRESIIYGIANLEVVLGEMMNDASL